MWLGQVLSPTSQMWNLLPFRRSWTTSPIIHGRAGWVADGIQSPTASEGPIGIVYWFSRLLGLCSDFQSSFYTAGVDKS